MSAIQGKPIENINPEIKAQIKTDRSIHEKNLENDDEVYDPFDAIEVFDLIREVRDPEHPLSLEQLGVVVLNQVEVYDSYSHFMI